MLGWSMDERLVGATLHLGPQGHHRYTYLEGIKVTRLYIERLHY